MKIILENELEKRAWGMMMEAHCKWWRNNGESIRGYLDWFFEDLYKEETDKLVREEVERRLRDEFGEEFFAGVDEYVKSELEGYARDELTGEERQELEQEFREDYRYVWEQIDDERENLLVGVRDELRGIYYTFFNAPEKLTVVYDVEVIQGGDAE